MYNDGGLLTCIYLYMIRSGFREIVHMRKYPNLRQLTLIPQPQKYVCF